MNKLLKLALTKENNLIEVDHLEKHSEKYFYALICLVSLWATAGGSFDLFWARQFVLILALGIFSFIFHKNDARNFLLKSEESVSAKHALLFFMAGAFCAFILKIIFIQLPWSQPQLLALQNGNPFLILIWCSFGISLWHYCFRCYIAPLWGILGVSVLEAIYLGVGSQNMVLFLSVLLSSTVASYIYKRFHFLNALAFVIAFFLLIHFKLQ